jgi:KUP system potassium uptake protein
MLMTSTLLFIAMREVWGWGLAASGAIAGAFLCIDAGFFLANLMKVAEGGYVPLLLAGVVYGAMLIWHRRSTAVAKTLGERLIPVKDAPYTRLIERIGEVVAHPILGGLHHRYARI